MKIEKPIGCSFLIRSPSTIWNIWVGFHNFFRTIQTLLTRQFIQNGIWRKIQRHLPCTCLKNGYCNRRMFTENTPTEESISCLRWGVVRLLHLVQINCVISLPNITYLKSQFGVWHEWVGYANYNKLHIKTLGFTIATHRSCYDIKTCAILRWNKWSIQHWLRQLFK